MAEIGGIAGGGGSGATGWLRIVDVEPQGDGVVDQKTYDSSGTILQGCRTSTLLVSISIKSAFPTLSVGGDFMDLDLSADGGHYEGAINVQLLGAGDLVIGQITADGGVGATDTVSFAVEAPPVIEALAFSDTYPGPQTELKAGDLFAIEGQADKPIDAIEILDLGACSYALIEIPESITFLVQGTIANRGNTPEAYPAWVRVRDAGSGAFSAPRATNAAGGSVDAVDLVWCNNLKPTITIDGLGYPAGQSALKNSESANVVHTVTNYDEIAYDSPNGDLSIANATAYEEWKGATRIGGNYNVGTNNFRVIATRTANGGVTVAETVVRIAHVAAQITVSHAGARIKSGNGVGLDTTITLASNQQLYEVPTLEPAVGYGSFIGAFVGLLTNFTATLRVTDAQNPMNGQANAWLNLSAKNLAGIVTTTITTGATYVIGGFNARTLNFAAFTANSTEAIPLTDQTKLSASSFSNGNTSVRQAFGTADTSDAGKEGWYAPTAASGSVSLRMLHAPTVAANSGGVTLALVQESA